MIGGQGLLGGVPFRPKADTSEFDSRLFPDIKRWSVKRGLYFTTLILLIGILLPKISLAVSKDAQQAVHMSLAKFASDDVDRIDVIQIPPGISTYTKVTPAMIETGYLYKLSIAHIRTGLYGRDFQGAMASVFASPSASQGDLRWAVIFFDCKDNRMGAIYFDARGENGYVDYTSVSFRGDLFNWLNKNFSGIFR